MNLKEIIKQWLIKHKYDGLCKANVDCGCGTNDFMPCGNENCDLENCKPAYLDKDGLFYKFYKDKK